MSEYTHAHVPVSDRCFDSDPLCPFAFDVSHDQGKCRLIGTAADASSKPCGINLATPPSKAALLRSGLLFVGGLGLITGALCLAVLA